MADKLEFKIELDRNEKPIATINNFPGLYAEMSKKELEKMARELLEIAKKM